MKSNKLKLIIIFVGFMAAGFLWKVGLKSILSSMTTLDKVNLEAASEQHPYGRPFTGVLPWENDRNFHEICAKSRIAIRMAAFQTTLPDPLPGEEYNVALGARMLASTLLKPGEIFSMNTRLRTYSLAKGFKEGPTYMGGQVTKTIGGGVCKIATTLYNVITLANLQIIERHNHGMQVPYVPPGQDATVFYGSKDLKFRNNTTDTILVWAETKENTLYMAVYGRVKPPLVRWHHQILHRFPTYVIYKYNKNLRPNEKNVIIPGADGLSVRSWLTIHYQDGRIETRKLGISFYNPLPELVERGR